MSKINLINARRYILALSLSTAPFLTKIVKAREILPDPMGQLGSDTKAMGSTAVTRAGGYSTLIVNPGAAAFDEDYVLGLGYLGSARTLTASLVDNKSSFIGGGLYYNRRDTKKGDISNSSAGDFRRTEDRVGLSFFGKASDAIGVGAGVKWARRQSSVVVSNESNLNGDIGALIKLQGDLRIGASIVNIFDDDKGLHPRSIHIGVSQTTMKKLTVSAEMSFIEKPALDSQFSLLSSSRFTWGVGGEYRLDSFSFRGGYRDARPWNQRWVTGGVGVRADKFEANYAFEGLVDGVGESLHNVSLSVYF
ncbi:hypothetical protein GW915_02280 [bacterium]|nr:hypothetical protein [bacterium]